ncbi:MAG: hypothetical protein J0H14_10735 [Alphaproteobacteria bacterium]|nr:hypothetical protein [Alphaproteobacteria bacterium]
MAAERDEPTDGTERLEPDDAVERLEAALERIERAAAHMEAGAGRGADLSEQLAPRLDALIQKLRTALGEPN